MQNAIQIYKALEQAVGGSNVLTDPELTVGYGTPWAAAEGVTPAAVVRPGDAAEAAAVLRTCAEYGRAAVLQGGNTGLVRGGVPASPEEIVISTSRMNNIGEVDRESLQVVAGAGTTLEAMQAKLEPEGLELPIDLAARSQATLGGMAATNAGGARAFRHGTMRHQVAGVEAVLADGTIVQRLGGVLKDSTGYDWASVLIGSEGTLALITRLHLRLRPIDRSRAAALVPVDSFESGLRLAVALRDELPGLEAAEFLLPGTLNLVCDELDLPAPFTDDEQTSVPSAAADPSPASAGLVEATDDPTAPAGDDEPVEGTSTTRHRDDRPASPNAAEHGDGPALVLLENRAPTGAYDLLIEALSEHPEAEHAVLAEGAETARLWRYREGTGEALARHPVVKLDVALPLSSLSAGLASLERAAIETGGPTVRPYLFGHLLDGNVHVNLGAVPDDRREPTERAVLEAVLSHGGSIGAEHGIGRAKTAWLPADRTEADITAMRTLKQALDPGTLLNPGVLFD
jgi:FAD/FMN-containing dehydrogenase